MAETKQINVVEELESEQIVTPGQLVMRRFLRNKLAIAGITILSVIALFSIIGPFFSPYGEYELFYEQDGIEVLDNQSADLTMKGTKLYDKKPPSARHLLGTDKDGRDILTRLMYGGRISLTIGFICVLIELLLGMLLGGLAGYYGGWVDMIIMRLVDMINCIPNMPIVLIYGVAMQALNVPQENRIFGLMIWIGVLGFGTVARMVRGQILSLREQEFMVAAEAIGLRASRKIFKHLIPNVMPQLVVSATLDIGSIILYEAALSFLGFGVPYPYASWGNMVNYVNDPMIMRNQLHMWVTPGVLILATVMAFNFVGEGLRDAFDPKMKR